MPPKNERFEALAEAYEEGFVEPEPPKQNPKASKGRAWHPKTGPIGKRVIADDSRFIFLHGERGSLKTGLALHKVVTECYRNYNNLGIIATIVRGSATEGGAWEKLNSLTLPEWHDGIGLDFTEPRMDDQKNRYVFIANRFGGWSRIVLKSMPYGANIGQRIKGTEPGIFFFDELTEAESEEYFIKPIQQLRRPNVAKPQFIAAGNPPSEGMEHWTYRKFWTEPLSEKYPDAKPEDLPTSFREGDYAVYHIPLSENVFWTEQQKSDYQKTLMPEARSDPSAIDRLLRGIWTARPTGHGLFKEFFAPNIHVRGDFKNGMGIAPVKGFPFILGYDLGQVYSSVSFEQLIPTRAGKNLWLVIDEIVHLNEKILYKNLAGEIMERLRYWERFAGYTFSAIHIADDSAVTQWRPNEGSYDAWDIEREFERLTGQKVKILGCPKGDGSISARVRLCQAKLAQEELIISATCPAHKGMLMQLESKKDDPEKPARSKWVHVFDSMTYPMFKMELGYSRNYLQSEQVAPRLIHCGNG